MIERLSEIRDTISFNIWFITELPMKTVEQIIDFALFAIIAIVAMIVVTICLFIKYRKKKNNEIASLKSQLAKERERHEVDEDDQMVEITSIGKDGAKTVKVPAIHVSFKESYYNEIKKEGGNK